jgi:hypothetical protein
MIRATFNNRKSRTLTGDIIMTKRITYTVYYRTGGTERFRWNKCTPVDTQGAAQKQKQEIERQGYKALYERTDRLDVVGLPDENP